MKMIVGLGNPGKKYLLTPHNIGWMVIDSLSHNLNIQLRKKENYMFQTTSIHNEKVILLKPLTYMNLSGKSIKAAINYYNLSLNEILIIHDDIDLPFLTLRFQKNRGPGGHNGIKSIHTELDSEDYARLKIGMKPLPQNKDIPQHSQKNQKKDTLLTSFDAWTQILIPSQPSVQKTKTDVLKTFSKEEQKLLPDFLKLSIEVVKFFILEGLEKSANRYNTKNHSSPTEK